MEFNWSISLLSSLSQEELKRFDDYLRSPFFNRSRRMLQLFRMLRYFHPEYKSWALTNERLYERLFPKQEFNLSTINNLFAKLHNHLLDYMLFESLRYNSKERNALLLKEVGRRRLDKLFLRLSTVIDEKLSNQSGLYSEMFLDRYGLAIARLDYSYLNERITKRDRVESDFNNLNDAAFYLYTYFFTEYSALAIQKYVYSVNYDVSDDNDLVEQVKSLLNSYAVEKLSSMHKHGYILKLYLRMFEIFVNFEDESKYKAYKNEIKKCSSRLSSPELSFHYLKLVSYWILKIVLNKTTDGGEELFIVYCEMLEKKLYREGKDEYLNYELFRDILLHSIKIKKYPWVEKFIEEYSKEGPPKERENMYHYGYARFYFEIFDFKKALEHLNKVDTSHTVFKYDYKNLLLRVYYETNEYDGALYLIKTYKELLSSKDILSSSIKAHYKWFVKYTERLIRINEGDKKKVKFNMKALKRNLLRLNNVSFKDWLLEKIDQAVSGIAKVG
jgi:hypothetical protein